MAEIRIEGAEPIEQTEVNERAAELVPDGLLMRERVAQVFDLRPGEVSKYGKQLDGLIEYAKVKTDDHSPEGIKWALRQLSLKVGTPPLGEKIIPYLYRYAYLYLEGRRIEGEKQKYLRGEED